jgi:hypothetical protein
MAYRSGPDVRTTAGVERSQKSKRALLLTLIPIGHRDHALPARSAPLAAVSKQVCGVWRMAGPLIFTSTNEMAPKHPTDPSVARSPNVSD